MVDSAEAAPAGGTVSAPDPADQLEDETAAERESDGAAGATPSVSETRPSWFAPHRDRLVATAVLTVLFVVATLVMAFPDITRLASANAGDYGDSFLIQWLVRWNAHALFDGSSVFHPNIYWPTRDTLLYSDTLLALAPLAGLLASVVGWLAAYNLLYIGGWVSSLASAYVLARWVGASRAGSVLAGFVFTFAAVRLGHYGHFQLLFAFLVPLSIWLLLRFLDERKWWQAASVGLAGAAAFLNAGYIAVVLAPTLALVAFGWLAASRFRPGRRFFTGLALTGLVALALSWPVLDRYGAQGDFLRRPYIHVAAVSPKDFLAPATGSLIYGWLEDWTDPLFENRLFPGFLAVILGMVGAGSVVTGRRRGGRGHAPPADRPPADDPPADDPSADDPPADGALGASRDLRRRGLVLVVLASVPALVLAFGKYLAVGTSRIPLPYAWVADVPGFQSIRAFGRFTVIPLAALGLLAALGYDRLVAGRRPSTKMITAAVVGIVMLTEYKARIVLTPRVDRAPFTAVNRALARLPGGPVVELPMADIGNVDWGFTEAPRMLLSAADWKPRVNGYSGYFPPGYGETVTVFNTLDDGGPASPEALALLDRFQVRYLIIRTAPLDGDPAKVGRSFQDEAGVARILQALPAERVERITTEGAAVLVRLRPRLVAAVP